MTSARKSNQRRNREAVEDYLKAIYLLAEKESPVSTSQLAQARQVRPASVTNMLQRLDRMELVAYEKHRGVTLTPSGRRLALKILRHHRLIELYLTEALGFAWDEVHDQAEILEHVVSEKLEARIDAVLGNPQLDPHGEPIPTADGEIARRETRSLVSLKKGVEAVVARIVDDTNGELLRHLSELGLRLGSRIRVLEKAPFDGPLTISIHDCGRRVIGFRAAAHVHVESQANTRARRTPSTKTAGASKDRTRTAASRDKK